MSVSSAQSVEPGYAGVLMRLRWRARPSYPWMAGSAVWSRSRPCCRSSLSPGSRSRPDGATDAALIFRGRVGELLINTVVLLVLAVPLCALLAIALAWLTERSDLPGARIWAWLAVAPLAVPTFVHSYAWISLAPGFNGLIAAVFISVIAYFPFLYLPIAATLRRLDPGLEDAAASLGLTPWRVFLRVVLPQLRLALCGGGLIIGLHLLAEYGLFGMIRFDTFTTAIVDQFQSTFNGPGRQHARPACSRSSASPCWGSKRAFAARSAMRAWAPAPPGRRGSGASAGALCRASCCRLWSRSWRSAFRS